MSWFKSLIEGAAKVVGEAVLGNHLENVRVINDHRALNQDVDFSKWPDKSSSIDETVADSLLPRGEASSFASRTTAIVTAKSYLENKFQRIEQSLTGPFVTIDMSPYASAVCKRLDVPEYQTEYIVRSVKSWASALRFSRELHKLDDREFTCLVCGTIWNGCGLLNSMELYNLKMALAFGYTDQSLSGIYFGDALEKRVFGMTVAIFMSQEMLKISDYNDYLRDRITFFGRTKEDARLKSAQEVISRVL